MLNDIANIEKIFGKVSQVPAKDAYYTVNSTAKIYPQFIKVFTPNEPYTKKIPFLENENILTEDWTSRVLDTDKTSNEDNLQRSLRKTKTTISDLSLCNEFTIFATFTFSPKKSDRQNPEAVKKQMANWLYNQRKQHGKFSYLIVPEFHKDGKSLHFHALLHNYKGMLLETSNRINGRQVYHFKSYTLGINSAVKIDDIVKVSSYITKYITKDMPQFHGKHRFWTSTGLKRPTVIDNPDNSLLHGNLIREWQNEYGLTRYYSPHLEQLNLLGLDGN